MEPIRRVVTAHDERGSALFSSDETLSPLELALVPGFESFELWSTASAPSIPDRTGSPGTSSYFPVAGGTVFRVVTFPPDAESVYAADFDFGAALEEAKTKVPDLVAKLEPGNPGMHTTDSVDYAVVIDGELDCELDEGRTVHLAAGDCLVQRGTRHAWRNPGDQPARVAFILLGGTRR
ncbi:MAG TPA: cupin domain-containing protein [Acidimicrobiales bacterium]|nr:cupin domain-containing protein [Acidimicrobiales bacterium]